MTDAVQYQNNLIADYTARLLAMNTAALRVRQLQLLAGATPDNPYGSLQGADRNLLDLAMQDHIRAHGELTAFLRDTPSNLSRSALAQEQISAQALRACAIAKQA